MPDSKVEHHLFSGGESLRKCAGRENSLVSRVAAKKDLA
jgi:hypothetical protein